MQAREMKEMIEGMFLNGEPKEAIVEAAAEKVGADMAKFLVDLYGRKFETKN